MKRLLSIITVVVVLIVVGGGFIVQPLAPIITGYAAKNLASAIFVANRTQEAVEKEDLHFSFIRFVRNHVDYDKKEVTSRFLFWQSKAIYIEGYGCTLLRDYTEEEVRSRPYPTTSLNEVLRDTLAWPTGERLADTIPAGIDMVRLYRVLDQAFADTLPMKGTFAVAVAYKNQLVAERYRDDFTSSSRFLSWSMAKSVINAFAGVLVGRGELDLHKAPLFEAWQSDRRQAITLAHLMQMNSGLQWNEDYGSNSDVNCMLFKEGDMPAYAINKPLDHQPDSLFYYSSGSTNVVCRIIREAIGNDSLYHLFPRQALFEKIGMVSALFETDASGEFIGSSYLYASMRDYVRFGLLYLNEGRWMGDQLLPEGWTQFTTTPSKGSDGGYGAFFWLNQNDRYPGAPKDLFSCNGHDGQYIFIIPSKELVVVRTGFSPKGTFDEKRFIKSVVDAVE